MFLYQFNYCAYCLQGGGTDTLKFNLHIIGLVKKGCEFNQKKCELFFKIIVFVVIKYQQKNYLTSTKF
jgi:hypothetical protein